MTRRKSIPVVILIMFVWSSVSADQEYNPGKSWSRVSTDSQVYWVWGASKGQELLFEELQIKNAGSYENAIPMSDAQTISQVMSDLYRDPANTYVPWKYMMVVAKMKLHGATTGQVVERLELLRSYAAYERSKQ
ncbi:MAG: hypothetical protein GKR94_14350 [Gammaproteobacteria bacterium]|nr:hypothetical protein [Gammaproteobacteria bacterium]